MALQGNLRDFDIPEIFQLISTQQKTGILKIEIDSATSYGIYFLRGFVQFVEKNPHHQGRNFLEFLANSGVIKKRLASEIVKRAEKTAESAIKILLEQKEEFKESDLKKAISVYLYENMIDLINLRKGDFTFITRKSELDQTIFEPISIDNVLMESYRTWDELKKEVEGGDPWKDVYVLLKDRKEAFDEAKNSGILGEKLKIVLLIDGKRNLMDLALRSLLGRLETLKTISRLKELNIVKKLEVKEEEKVPEIAPVREKERNISFYIFAGLILVFSASVAYVRRNIERAQFTFSYTPRNSFQEFILHERVKASINLYNKFKGSLPSQIDELVKEGFISRDELTIFRLKVYYYKNSEENFTLIVPVQK